MSAPPGEDAPEQFVVVRGQRFTREDLPDIGSAQVRAEARLALQRQYGAEPGLVRRPPPLKVWGKNQDAVALVDIQRLQKRCLGLSVSGATSDLNRVASEFDMRLAARAKRRSRPGTAAGVVTLPGVVVAPGPQLVGEAPPGRASAAGAMVLPGGEAGETTEGAGEQEEFILERPATAPPRSLWTVTTPEMRLAELERTKQRRLEIAFTVQKNRDKIRDEYREQLYKSPVHHMAKIRYLQEEGKHLKELAPKKGKAARAGDWMDDLPATPSGPRTAAAKRTVSTDMLAGSATQLKQRTLDMLHPELFQGGAAPRASLIRIQAEKEPKVELTPDQRTRRWLALLSCNMFIGILHRQLIMKSPEARFQFNSRKWMLVVRVQRFVRNLKRRVMGSR